MLFLKQKVFMSIKKKSPLYFWKNNTGPKANASFWEGKFHFPKKTFLFS